MNADRQLASGQIEVKKVEAAFVFKIIVGPAAVVAMAAAGQPITLPVFDFTEMSTILLAMLGLGGVRTVEKVKGV